jgi:hypothetical protein
MASVNASGSASDPLIAAAPNFTSSPVRLPNKNMFNGAVDAVTRPPRKPIKRRHLSAPVENLN